jgi:hypothetical protein
MAKITKVKFIGADGKWVTENCHDITTCREHSYKLQMTKALIAQSKGLKKSFKIDEEELENTEDIMKVFEDNPKHNKKIKFDEQDIRSICVLAISWYSSINTSKWDDHLGQEVFPEVRVPQNIRTATRNAMQSAQDKLIHDIELNEEEIAALKTGAAWQEEELKEYDDFKYGDFKFAMQAICIKIKQL